MGVGWEDQNTTVIEVDGAVEEGREMARAEEARAAEAERARVRAEAEAEAAAKAAIKKMETLIAEARRKREAEREAKETAEKAKREAFEAAECARKIAEEEAAKRVREAFEEAQRRATEEARTKRLEEAANEFKPAIKELMDAVLFRLPREEVEMALLALTPALFDPETTLLALECGSSLALLGVVQLYLHFGVELDRAEKGLQDLVSPLRAAKRLAQKTEDEVDRLISLGADESKTSVAVHMLDKARKASEECSKALGLLEDEHRGKSVAKAALEAEKERAQGTVQLALDAIAKMCGAGGQEAIRVFADKGAISLLSKVEREFPSIIMPTVGENSLKELLLSTRLISFEKK